MIESIETKPRAHRWWPGKSVLARNSGWMFLGYGLRIIVQAGYFILIARSLGSAQYGAFVGVTALVAIIAPFSSLGTGNLLVKNVSIDPSRFRECWGNALLMSILSGSLLLVLVMAIAHLLLPISISWIIVLLVGVADLIVVKGADIGAQAFQAVDQLRYTAKLNLLPSVLRFISAAIVWTVWHRSSAVCWSWFYLGGTLLSSAIAIVLTNSKLGTPMVSLSRLRSELKEGLYFGASVSAQTVYNDIDKTMLARMSTLDATGIYAAAYRLIEVAFTPVRSVLYAAYPQFFRHGQNGIAATHAYAKRLISRMLVYSGAVFAALFVTAPIIPFVLGHEYERTIEALRWLAFLPFLRTIHQFLADSLTGAGHQGARTAVQIGVAILNIGLNLWLIPAYSWRGAAWASLGSDGLLTLGMYLAFLHVLRKERPVGELYLAQPYG